MATAKTKVARTMKVMEATKPPKPLKVDGKLVAYVPVTDDGVKWYIGIVVDGDAGYRPVSDYGPYDEERAAGVAARLNERAHVGPRLAAAIFARSMRKHIFKSAPEEG